MAKHDKRITRSHDYDSNVTVVDGLIQNNREAQQLFNQTIREQQDQHAQSMREQQTQFLQFMTLQNTNAYSLANTAMTNANSQALAQTAVNVKLSDGIFLP